ncbi:transposase [Bradyrhizobium sp. CSA207]|uniref:transposase n=1 Tax=Bradyrhizobium sp. CSA207 TaxID=2698826 RepID=UPI0023B19EBC|nr:transposase [Bradyrhizobium sp. CSA207]
MPGQEGDSYRRVEVITGERRRRRWTSEEKARIAAESFEEGANISEVARRNGVSRGLLTVWRRQVAAAVAGKARNFVPIQIGAESDGGMAGESECISSVQMKSLEIATPPAKVCGVVEIEVNGARIRVEPAWSWRRFRWCYRRFEGSGDCATVRLKWTPELGPWIGEVKV